ncbi:MAG: alpha-(1-_3)-arabinofuranosyltransferase family protein [bacterium]
MTAVIESGPRADGGSPNGPSASPSADRVIHRLRLVAVCAALSALAFIQDPGRIAADTKLDLAVDPSGFLARALTLWEPLGFFGQLQNQAYGYLFPMGPFYAAADAVGVPAWVAQRLWWSLLLCTAFLGVVRLSRYLGVGSPTARIVAGLSYALAPRMVTELGVLSVEVLPFALAPWVIVPLAAAGEGRLGARRAAALSGLAVLACGGVNAVATFAVLPLAAWWIVTRFGGSARWRLLGWWALAVVLATAWWLAPLVVLGRYSPPFLDWIESSSVTTLVTSPDVVLRGSSQWVAYVADGGGPVWPAGWQIISSPLVIVATSLVAAAGLAGLSLRRTAFRPFLVGGVLAGLVLVSAGHVGPVTGFGAEEVRAALDGALAPLRNTHKFDVLLRLPLAIGVGWAVQALLSARGRPDARRPLAAVAVAGLAVAVAVGAWPALTGSLTRDRSFAGIPGYWSETAAWLADQEPGGRALLVPGASFGVYSWGRTQDEPLQPLATTPWAVRDAVPLSSAGNIRWLDAVQERLNSGRGSPGLADALARAGVRYVVVRNDIDRRRADSPRGSLIRQALVRSGGFTPVAGFGPILPPYRTETTVVDAGLQDPSVAVEVWRDESPYAPADPRVAVRELSSGIVASGAAEGVVDLADAGVLGARAVVVAGDDAPLASLPLPQAVTDSYRRTEVNVGRAWNNRSQTLTAEDPFVQDRRVSDYLPLDPEGRQSTAAFSGGRVRASSSGSDADSLRGRSPAAQPWAAVDGDPQTAWISGDLAPGVGQWWEADLEEPFEAASLLVRFVVGDAAGTPPAAVTVTTDTGERTVEVRATDGPQTIPLPPGPTRTLRLTLAAVSDGGDPDPRDLGEGFGIREVELPAGAVVRRQVRVPGVADGGPIVLTERKGARAGCAIVDAQIACDAALSSAGEEQTGIRRVVTVDSAGAYRVRIEVRPRPSPGLDDLLRPLPEDAVVAEATSVQVSDPAVRAQAAVDGSLETAWVASPLEPRPELSLSWREPTRVSGVQLITRPSLPTSRPLRVTATVDGVQTTGVVTSAGVLRFPPRQAREVTLRFDNQSTVRTLDPLTGSYAPMPLGITEVRVLGDRDLPAGPRPTDEAVVPCGFGPALSVDGTVLTRTEVSATVGDVLTDALVQARPCEGRVIRLEPGTHAIDALSTAEYAVERVVLEPLDEPALPLSVMSPEVLRWDATQRQVEVPPGAQPRLLETSENANTGWQASIDGEPLVPARVDGWRQGWVLPAGAGGTVTLTFAPQRAYAAGLAGGAAGVLALLVLAAWPGRGRGSLVLDAASDRGARTTTSRAGRAALAVGAVVAAAAVAGVWGLLAAGWAAGVCLVVPRWWVAAGAAAVSGALAAAAPWPGRLDAPAALLAASAVLAVAAVTATAMTERAAGSSG